MQKGDKIKLTEKVLLVNKDFSEAVGSLEKGAEGVFEGTKGMWLIIRVDAGEFKGLLVPVLDNQIELAK